MHDEIQIHNSTNHRTASRMRTAILRMVAVIVVSALAALVLAVAYLSYVGQPSIGSSMKFEGFIELPRDNLINIFDYMAISDRAILVGNISSGSVVKVRLSDDSSGPLGVVSEQKGEGNAHGVAVVPNANKAFVTRSGKNVVDVFEVSSLRVIGRVPVSDDADAILYDSASGMIYVANGTLKLATVIDPVNLKPVATIPFGAELEFAAADINHGLVYQNLHDTNEVAAVNLKTNSVVGRWPLTSCIGPTGLALDPSQERLYAVCSGNSQMVVFSIPEHRVIASVAVGGKPDSVALDLERHRIYSVGLLGVMTVVEQAEDHYRILDNIHTHVFAHTLLIDPQSHRVFVTYATMFSSPRIAVFSPKP